MEGKKVSELKGDEKMHPFLLTVFSAVDLVIKLSNQRLDKIINDLPKMVNKLFFFPTKTKEETH